MMNIYYYMYYRISKFFLHPFLNGEKAKEKTEGVSGGWAIMTLILATLTLGVLYWGFGINVSKDALKLIPIACGVINLYIFIFRKKGLYLSLDKKYSKEPKFSKTIKGWGIFLLFIFMFVQFWWLRDYHDEHPDYEGVVNLLIKKIW